THAIHLHAVGLRAPPVPNRVLVRGEGGLASQHRGGEFQDDGQRVRASEEVDTVEVGGFARVEPQAVRVGVASAVVARSAWVLPGCTVGGGAVRERREGSSVQEFAERACIEEERVVLLGGSEPRGAVAADASNREVLPRKALHNNATRA